MKFFKSRNDAEEFKILEEYKHNIFNVMNKEAYLSKKEYLPLVEKARETFLKLVLLDNSSKLVSWCRREKVEYADLKELMDFYRNTDTLIKNHNDAYFSRHLMIDERYLDSIPVGDNYDKKLTREQREVLLSDEDRTLIISDQGKTTALEAKIRYLVDKKHLDPSRILIVTYTRKAYKELMDRFRELDIPVVISTFHMLYTVLGTFDGKMPKIASEDLLYNTVYKYFEDNKKNAEFIRQVVLFTTCFMDTSLGEDDIGLFFEELRKNNVATLKSEEIVRSPLERKIANYLYIAGVDYEYEPLYKCSLKQTLDVYYPDFLIKQGNKEIYIDCFSITESGASNRFNNEDIKKYQKSINDRIELHREQGTLYIPLYVKYNDNRDSLEHLIEELTKYDISLEDHSKDVYKKIVSEKYINKFIELICAFISRFKMLNYDSSKFEEWESYGSNFRTKLFISICHNCYLAYIEELRNSNCLEYEDLVNNTLSVFDKIISNGDKLPYEYIFVDEYQDIILHKYDLCGKFSKCSDAKIIALGDDIETRYGFEDGKMDLYKKFNENVGYSKIIRGYSGLVEAKPNPLVFVGYDNNTLGETIENIIDRVATNNDEIQTLLLVGRYGYEGSLVAKSSDILSYDNGSITCSKYPKLKIIYTTINSAKGFEYDNVIYLGDLGDVNPYDSLLKLEDNDILTNLSEENKNMLCLAINKTKNKVYVLDNRDTISRFMLDLKDMFKDVANMKMDLEEVCIDHTHNCPRCGYPLQKRKNNSIKRISELWFCSNDSEVCGFVTNEVDGGNLSICKCPKCDGYLKVKIDKLGNKKLQCTNYKKNGDGCNVVIEGIDDLDKENFDIMFFDENVDINKLYYIKRPYKELVDTVMEVINHFMDTEILLSNELLFSILSGEMSEEVECFELFNNPKFGYITSKDKNKFYKLFDSMMANEIIDEDENEGLMTKKETLDDNDYRKIFTSL